MYDAFEIVAMWGLVVFAFGLVLYLAYLQYRKSRHRRHRRRKRAREAQLRAESGLPPLPEPARRPLSVAEKAKAHEARPPEHSGDGPISAE